MQRIGIVGAGAWGTALALTARCAGRDVVLWARDPALAEEINARRENRPYLPDVTLGPAIRVSPEPAELTPCDVLLLAIPAQHLRAVSAGLAEHITEKQPLIVCSKGIEQTSLKLMTEVLAETLPGRPLAVLSGPNFAAEVARGLPAAATLAAEDKALAERLAAALGSKTFRPYISPDTVGAQVGGAVKNVIAIACGVVAGRALGDNARAALITRGLAEVMRLGRAKGANPETLMGLSGLGDLTLTCTNTLSRNYSLGQALGEGHALKDIMAARRSVAEGVFSAQAVVALAQNLGVEMPISQGVDAILNKGAGVDETIEALLARPFKTETA
ncbi:MAG: NAD(P)H-dependent glycerol-3-phosphate dehydrogenase [Kiloniellales bacterium]